MCIQPFNCMMRMNIEQFSQPQVFLLRLLMPWVLYWYLDALVRDITSYESTQKPSRGTSLELEISLIALQHGTLNIVLIHTKLPSENAYASLQSGQIHTLLAEFRSTQTPNTPPMQERHRTAPFLPFSGCCPNPNPIAPSSFSFHRNS